MGKKINYFIVLFLILISNISSFGQEDNIEENEHNISNYHFAIFTGFTSNLEHKTDDFTLGIDYEQRLPLMDRMFGIGFILEAVFAEHKENILAIPITAHLNFAGIKLSLAPGVVFGERVATIDNSHSNLLKFDKTLTLEEIEETENYQNFLFRVGLGYDFHFNMFSVTPNVSFDFYNGVTSVVWGIGFGLSL